MTTTAKRAATAQAWASAVTARQYRKSRHEFDQLVVAAEPAYAEVVAVELDRFTRATTTSRAKYDAAHPNVRVFTPPWMAVRGLLLAVVVLGSIVSFGLMYPAGRGVRADIPRDWWPHLATMSSVFAAAAVLAVIARALPYRGFVPPRDASVWFPPGFGAAALVRVVFVSNLNPATPQWLVPVLAGSVAVGIVHALGRVIVRRRNPRLAREADRAIKDRSAAFLASTQAHADHAASRIIAGFNALPASKRRHLTDELERALRVLRDRALFTTTPASVAAMHSRIDATRRGYFPGFLLLSRAVEDLNTSAPARDGRSVRWFVSNYLSEHVALERAIEEPSPGRGQGGDPRPGRARDQPPQ